MLIWLSTGRFKVYFSAIIACELQPCLTHLWEALLKWHGCFNLLIWLPKWKARHYAMHMCCSCSQCGQHKVNFWKGRQSNVCRLVTASHQRLPCGSEDTENTTSTGTHTAKLKTAIFPYKSVTYCPKGYSHCLAELLALLLCVCCIVILVSPCCWLVSCLFSGVLLLS